MNVIQHGTFTDDGFGNDPYWHLDNDGVRELVSKVLTFLASDTDLE